MGKVTIRDLRNHGGAVLERVTLGETLVVTRGGKPAAELRPLARQPLRAEVLLSRWQSLPTCDPVQWQADIDATLDSVI
ncbi:MAG: type II toxin-antitoxin system prevent-host-death family antitoxin [Nitrococcus sp.]|nr:type II toxin-antitoxin system prevent-host-death family antitoxin [Nitrococcus sp.]